MMRKRILALVVLALAVVGLSGPALSGWSMFCPLDSTGKVAITYLPTGSTSSTVAIGNDSRLSDSRTPLAHASTHVSTGSDPIANAIAAGASGLMSGADKTKLDGVSGSNTGDQTISITGDVTASGSTGALSSTVTKLNGTALSGLGTGLLKNTTGTGVPSIAASGDLPGGPYIPTSTTHLSGDVATTTTVNGHALSGNVTVTASDVGLGSVTNDVQTKAAVVPNTAPSAGQLLVGNAGGTAYAPVTASADVTVASTGAMTISAGAVTLAKQANLAANSIQGNNTGSPAAPIALTVAQTQALLLVQPRGFTTTAMAGTTTTLTNASTRLQIFTGSGATNQTVVLPDATTLPFVDTEYEIDNTTSGTGTITLQANGGATLYIFGPGAGGRVSLLTKSVAAGTWDVDAYNPNPASGKVLNVSNSLTLAGTDGTTATFSATGAGQLFVSSSSSAAAFIAAPTAGLQSIRATAANTIAWAQDSGGTTAASSGINTTETLISPSFSVPIGGFVAGSSYRIRVVGTCTATVGNLSTFTVRIGVNNTTGDTTLMTLTMTSATSGITVPFYGEFVVTVRSLNSSTGNVIASGIVTNTGTTGINTAATPVFVLGSVVTSINTTGVVQFISLAYKSAATTTTSTFQQVTVERIG